MLSSDLTSVSSFGATTLLCSYRLAARRRERHNHGTEHVRRHGGSGGDRGVRMKRVSALPRELSWSCRDADAFRE